MWNQFNNQCCSLLFRQIAYVVNELAATMKNMNAYNLEYLWDGTKVRPYGRAGIELAFKVSKSVSLMLETFARDVPAYNLMLLLP